MIFLCIQIKHSTMIKAVIFGGYSIEIWKTASHWSKMKEVKQGDVIMHG